jgi:hypothetical protein
MRGPNDHNREIGCQVGGLILGNLIDTCSTVHDNARKSGMKEKEYEGCWDSPPLNDMALAAHLIVRRSSRWYHSIRKLS